MDFRVHNSIAFSSNGHLLALGNLDGIINVWESSIGKLKNKLKGLDGKCHEINIQKTNDD